MRKVKLGFTLIEINLAIFVMATGILSICALYGLGYRENAQSEEDVFATAYADVALAPFVAALSSPQLTWEDWQQIGEKPNGDAQSEAGVDARWPNDGWCAYVDADNGNGTSSYRVVSDPRNTADGVFSSLQGALSSSGVSLSKPSIPAEFQYGLVVTRKGGLVQLSFRMSRRAQALLAQPAFVAEVRFQGGFNGGTP